VDAQAHLEPEEAMAEAALELSRHPVDKISGRTLLSLDLLREQGIHSVKTLDGSGFLPDYAF
jgi:hypothetical protein